MKMFCRLVGHARSAYVLPDQFDPDQHINLFCPRCGEKSCP